MKEIDWKFYGISFAILAVICLTFYLAKRDVEHHQGVYVQKMLKTAKLDDQEHFEQQAKSYVGRISRGRELNADQREKAEKIFAAALYERMQIWTNDRLDGLSPEITGRKQRDRMDQAFQEYEAMLAE